MGWLGAPCGIFDLMDSDAHCGSYISKKDLFHIVGSTENFDHLTWITLKGEMYVDEKEVHPWWSITKLKANLDEMILTRIIENLYPGVSVEHQVSLPSNRRRKVDLLVTWPGGIQRAIEFLGPIHFIPTRGKMPEDPRRRRALVEDDLGMECILWPFWIQRCARNVACILDATSQGKVAMWSANAHLSMFVFDDSAKVVTDLSQRFNSIRDNFSYCYLEDKESGKPEHSVLKKIRCGKVNKSILIPRGGEMDQDFWVPC